MAGPLFPAHEKYAQPPNDGSSMMWQSKDKLWFLLGVLTLAVAAGCPENGEYGSGSEGEGKSALEGTIKIDGSSTVYPITEAVASQFREGYPNVKVPVAISGTGGGFKKFVTGDTDISDASRSIKAEEFQRAIENNVSFIEVPVAYDGLSVVVNPQNDWVEQLTVEDLQRIFLDAEDKPTKWSELNPEWPDEALKMFIPGTDSGTFDYFKEVVVGESGKSIRSDVSASEDDNVLVKGIANEKGGIGFFGSAYYFENQQKLRGVPILNDAGEPVKPTPETIESGEYNPLSRPLFIYINADSLKRPEMKKFVEFYLAHAGEMANEVGYVSLPEDIYKRARENVENKNTGTVFLTPDGEKRTGSIVKLYTTENLTKTLD